MTPGATISLYVCDELRATPALGYMSVELSVPVGAQPVVAAELLYWLEQK